MATAITTYPVHTTTQAKIYAPATGFLHDLAEDIRTTGDQMQGKIHTDLFHKHLLNLTCCYFGLIVLLLAGMVPFLFFVNYKW